LQGLCNYVAVAIHNARRFQQERSEREQMSREANEARKIQEALLPRCSPYIPGFAVTGLSTPAGAVGGDWYDFIPFDDGRWGLVLADVSGKGMAAALLMSATRGMLRSLATACCPSEVLNKLNQLLVNDFPSGRFVTMLYAVLDPAGRTLRFASAGHLRPLLIENSHARFLETERGLPLGIGAGDYSEAQVELPEGSRLLFYSDGITEATNLEEDEYGAERLEKHFQRTDASPESILEDVRTFVNGAGLLDDATVILVKA
jgi:sigma-B regulation protein RsbU (phosphoserine phosphatase)